MGRARRKKEDEQKYRGCNLGFFVDSICAQKLLDGRGLFKNPARCDLYCLYCDIEYDLLLSETVFDLRFHTGELSVSTGFP